MPCCLRLLVIGLVVSGLSWSIARAGEASTTASTPSTQPTELPPASRLADSESGTAFDGKLTLWKGLDVDAWGWLSYLHDSPSPSPSYDVAEFSLNVNQSFGGTVALDSEINFIDDNGHSRGELEQAYITALLSKSTGAILTIGKFNANFGVEPHDFWNRLTGTTGLLFSAQPQDLVGVMLTQPLGNSDVKLRPFITTDFEGHLTARRPPSLGMTVEYTPNDQFGASITGMVGPGFVIKPYVPPPPGSAAYVPPDDPYSEYGDAIIGNWSGPDLDADSGGTLYFLDAKVSWSPRPDLTLAAEGLVGSTDSSYGWFSWNGVMLLANYNLTEHWRVFGRWSYLDDTNWIITHVTQRRHELSIGVAYEIVKNVEIRGEYRHDFSREAGDLDIVSVHLMFGI